jgi:zinc transport system substrate-binding protein
MRRWCFLTLVLCLALPFQTAWAEPIRVFVSIPPQKYFVEKIGGPLVNVSVMVPPGANPHAYEPKPGQMVELSKARAFFAVGIAFEHTWIPRFAALNKNLTVVHTDRGIAKRNMISHSHEAEHEDEHEHEAEHEDEHEAEHHIHHHADHDDGMDPHVWLSPPLVMLQARNILTALTDLLPEASNTLRGNYRRFIHEIIELDTELMDLFRRSHVSHPSFMVFHPAWAYFADAYGLEEKAVEVEGKEPKPAELVELIKEAREAGVKTIFVQPQMSARTAEAVARAVGASVTTADPLAEQWASNLKSVARHIAGLQE